MNVASLKIRKATKQQQKKQLKITRLIHHHFSILSFHNTSCNKNLLTLLTPHPKLKKQEKTKLTTPNGFSLSHRMH